MGRRLGQHFLFDPAILDRIVDAIEPGPNDRVIEIGPGRGTLTRRLAGRVAAVVAIERDAALAAALQAESIAGCTVVAADALEADWHTLLSAAPAGPCKVVGNVPYAISTPLIEKALHAFSSAVVVFLVQREVGERLAARPGSKAYGALSVGVQVTAAVERLFPVRAGSFRPPPRVESVVVRLRPRADPLVAPADRARFRAFVNALFGQRRRQLVRGLRTVWSVPPEEAVRILDGAGIDPTVRPEVLTPQEFVKLLAFEPR